VRSQLICTCPFERVFVWPPGDELSPPPPPPPPPPLQSEHRWPEQAVCRVRMLVAARQPARSAAWRAKAGGAGRERRPLRWPGGRPVACPSNAHT